MSKARFKEFLRFLRFDDKATRQERRQTDKLAAIREVFDYIAAACKKTLRNIGLRSSRRNALWFSRQMSLSSIYAVKTSEIRYENLGCC